MKIQFLQIGFQKSGSTFLEYNAYPNHPNIECIQAGRNGDLERLLLNKFILPDRLEYDQQAFEAELEDLRESIFFDDTKPVKGIMFEPFTFLYERRFDRKAVLERINESFSDVKVIMFIRNQETWLLSHYSQYLKGGGLLRLHDFVEIFLHSPILGSHYLDYFPLISYLFELFGHDRVLICLYEDLKISPQNVADSIFSFLNLPRAKINKNVVNPSLSKKVLGLRRFLNHFVRFDLGAPSYNFFRDMGDAQASVYQKFRHSFIYSYYKPITNRLCYLIDKQFRLTSKYCLEDKHKQYIKNRYSRSNNKLSKLLKTDLGKLGYPS